MNMRKLPLLMAFCLALPLSACQNQAKETTADYIGIDAAKTAALEAADIPAADADFSAAGLDNRNGTFFYQVCFSADGTEYEYAIDAFTGVVIEEIIDRNTADAGISGETEDMANSGNTNKTEDIANAGNTDKTEGTAGAESSDKTENTADTENTAQTENTADTGDTAGIPNAPEVPSQPPASAPSSPAILDQDTALSTALTHAGIAKEAARKTEVKRDYEDDTAIYKIEFRTDKREKYEYKINASTGAIISYDYEQDSDYLAPTDTSSVMLSEVQVREIVQKRVPGAPAENIFLHLDEDDGRMEYEGTLLYENMEYEFKVDAYSGSVTEWEAESTGRSRG